MKYVVANGAVIDKIDDQTVLFCGHLPSDHAKFTNGCGIDKEDKTHCYDCCAANERQSMIESGRATLFLTKDDGKWFASDWPGHLKFKVAYRKSSRHNWARTRMDVWFMGPDSHWWWGVSYGEYTQLLHCKRTKETFNAKAE